MKKVILVFTLFLFSTFVFAEIDTRGLTETQKAELALQAAKLKEEAARPLVSTAQKVTEVNNAAVDIAQKWVGVTTVISDSIVSTAAKLGVEANKFADTSLGRTTVFLIVWNYMGKDLILISLGGAVLLLGLPAVFVVYRKMMVHNIVYEDGTGIFGRKYRKVKERDLRGGEAFFFLTAGYVGASIVISILGVNLILSVAH